VEASQEGLGILTQIGGSRGKECELLGIGLGKVRLLSHRRRTQLVIICFWFPGCVQQTSQLEAMGALLA